MLEKLQSSEYQIAVAIFVVASIALFTGKSSMGEWTTAALGAAGILGTVRRIKAATKGASPNGEGSTD